MPGSYWKNLKAELLKKNFFGTMLLTLVAKEHITFKGRSGEEVSYWKYAGYSESGQLIVFKSSDGTHTVHPGAFFVKEFSAELPIESKINDFGGEVSLTYRERSSDPA